MTREEAIKVLEESKRQNEVMRDNPNTFYKTSDIVDGMKNAQKRIDAIQMAISALREQEERRWIPVTERLPDENNRWVLCLCVSGAIEVLKFDYTMWNWDAQYPGRCYMESYVTHWMPIPQLPKEVPENETI